MQLPVPWDPTVEAAFTNFSEKAFAAQAKTETLHPIDKQIYISSLREQLAGFYSDVEQGFEILLNAVLELNAAGKTLAGIEPTHKRSVKAIKHLFPNKQALQKVIQGDFFDERVPLFAALEMSPKAMEVLYEAACSLFDENKDEEARMACRTLLALAPHIADFWTAHGVSLLRLKRLEEAIESLERAIFLDSKATQALLLLCRALVEAGRTGEAQARLGEKLDDAAHRGDNELYNLLEAARFELNKFAARPAITL